MTVGVCVLYEGLFQLAKFVMDVYYAVFSFRCINHKKVFWQKVRMTLLYQEKCAKALFR